MFQSIKELSARKFKLLGKQNDMIVPNFKESLFLAAIIISDACFLSLLFVSEIALKKYKIFSGWQKYEFHRKAD